MKTLAAALDAQRSVHCFASRRMFLCVHLRGWFPLGVGEERPVLQNFLRPAIPVKMKQSHFVRCAMAFSRVLAVTSLFSGSNICSALTIRPSCGKVIMNEQLP